MLKPVLIYGLLVVSLLTNLFLYRQTRLASDHSKETTDSPTTTFPYLSPRIFAEHQNDIIINFMGLRNQLRADVSSYSFPIGLYFEYLPSGTSIGIEEKDEFAIASLLKVPLVMATFQAIKEEKFKLGDELTIRESDLDSGFGDLYKNGPGKIKIEEAMRQSLVTSDNTAKNVLVNTIPQKYLEDVFDSLDIPKDLSEDQRTVVISPKGYASILRSLYLSSYLPHAESNQILTWLTQSPFTDKIAAPIPTDIPVAHKIGSFETRDEQQSVFTDCGIIYIPKRPYILCVMAQAPADLAKNAMQFVSEHTYRYVKRANLTQPEL